MKSLGSEGAGSGSRHKKYKKVSVRNL